MADNNRNWNNQYQQSGDWDKKRNRFEEDDRDRENYRYGNANYGSDYHQNTGMRSNYGSGQYNESRRTGNMEDQTNYGGTYRSDYGSEGGGYNQGNWETRGSKQNWQDENYNQSQQWRDQDWNRRKVDYGDYNQDWQRRRNDYDDEWSNRRNVSGSYDHNRNRNYGSGYSRSIYDDRYGNSGYGEGQGLTGGYSNRNYNRNRDWRSYEEARNEGDRGWWDRTRDEVSSWFGDDDAERRRRIDKINGPNKGKGPRDYHRSEDRIREDVCDRLADDDYVDASDIHVQIQSDEVILTGTVHSREEKRRAEDIVESISGVHNVENRLRVGRNDMNFDRYTGTTTDSGGVGRESGTTNEIIRNTGNEKNKNK